MDLQINGTHPAQSEEIDTMRMLRAQDSTAIILQKPIRLKLSTASSPNLSHEAAHPRGPAGHEGLEGADPAGVRRDVRVPRGRDVREHPGGAELIRGRGGGGERPRGHRRPARRAAGQVAQRPGPLPQVRRERGPPAVHGAPGPVRGRQQCGCNGEV